MAGSSRSGKPRVMPAIVRLKVVLAVERAGAEAAAAAAAAF